jgi:gluconolactonase
MRPFGFLKAMGSAASSKHTRSKGLREEQIPARAVIDEFLHLCKIRRKRRLEMSIYASEFYEVIDPRFTSLVVQHIAVEAVYEGCLFSEGPAYFAAGRYLIFSDIPNDRLLRYDEANGSVSVFRSNCGNPNGNTVDRQGRLITCEHGGRRVSRTEHDGRITTLADRWEGKRLNSPNDVVVKSDGTIWFTDPTYGIDNDLDGGKAKSEIGRSNVYRIDPNTGSVTAVITDMIMPNGLAFSVDERTLYVVDSGRTHGKEHPAHVRAFTVRDDNTVTSGAVLADIDSGIFDGFRLDADGRLWMTAPDGVHCYDNDGTLLGKIKLPRIAGNVQFGGPRNNFLYICATTTLYLARLKVNGARYPLD